MDPKSEKPLRFNGTPGDYFIASLIYFLSFALSIIGGMLFGFKYYVKYIIGGTTVNGRKLKYECPYGEQFVFLFVNTLLCIITLGIYIFWFFPKLMQFIYDHSTYDDGLVNVPISTAPLNANSVPAVNVPALSPAPPVSTPVPATQTPPLSGPSI